MQTMSHLTTDPKWHTYLQVVRHPHANSFGSSNCSHKQLWSHMHTFIITLFSGGSECSRKLQWTSCSLLSLQTRCKTWGGTHRTSPCRHQHRSAFQPTDQSECSPHFLKEGRENYHWSGKDIWLQIKDQKNKKGNYSPNKPVSLLLKFHRALTARRATHSNVESPIRRLRMPNSTSRDPAPAVQVSLMLSGGTPFFKFTCTKTQDTNIKCSKTEASFL